VINRQFPLTAARDASPLLGSENALDILSGEAALCAPVEGAAATTLRAADMEMTLGVGSLIRSAFFLVVRRPGLSSLRAPLVFDPIFPPRLLQVKKAKLFGPLINLLSVLCEIRPAISATLLRILGVPRSIIRRVWHL
jgi:hypothetical protein